MVKPKMHGPEEVAFAVETFDMVEHLLNLPANTIKIGTQATSVIFDPSVVTIDSDGSAPRNRFTIVGLDQFGNSQTEVIEEYSVEPKEMQRTARWSCSPGSPID